MRYKIQCTGHKIYSETQKSDESYSVKIKRAEFQSLLFYGRYHRDGFYNELCKLKCNFCLHFISQYVSTPSMRFFIELYCNYQFKKDFLLKKNIKCILYIEWQPFCIE